MNRYGEFLATLTLVVLSTTGFLPADNPRDRRYLKPIPAALNYLRRSLLSDGRLARFYELKSNRPLYMYRRGDIYSLTYDDSKLPKHYGWNIEMLSAYLLATRRE